MKYCPLLQIWKSKVKIEPNTKNNWHDTVLGNFIKSTTISKEQRFGANFDGPLTPFGAKVIYKPIKSYDESRLLQFGTLMLPEIFMCHVLRAGGWSGDSLCEDMENLSASEFYVRRFEHQEVSR